MGKDCRNREGRVQEHREITNQCTDMQGVLKLPTFCQESVLELVGGTDVVYDGSERLSVADRTGRLSANMSKSELSCLLVSIVNFCSTLDV